MTRRPVTLIVLAALGVALLTGLGVWQLQRLHWKEALIAERTARLKSPPKPLHEVLAMARQGDDIDYMTVASRRDIHANRPAVLFNSRRPGGLGDHLALHHRRGRVCAG